MSSEEEDNRKELVKALIALRRSRASTLALSVVAIAFQTTMVVVLMGLGLTLLFCGWSLTWWQSVLFVGACVLQGTMLGLQTARLRDFIITILKL